MAYPPPEPGWDPDYSRQAGGGRSGNGVVWVLGALVVVLLVALAGVVGYLLASGDDDETAQSVPTSATSTSSAPTSPGEATSSGQAPRAAAPASACDPDQIAREAGIERRNVNVDRCLGDWALAHVYVPPGEPAGDTQYLLSRSGGSWTRYTGIPSTLCRQDAESDGMPAEFAGLLNDCSDSPAAQGDLGLATPLSRPACDGRGIVVLYSAVTPGAYAQEVGAALQRYPGASYLRTDMACPSLRQRDENGNVIYAVYRPSGYSRSELCADVRAAGGSAYGRWLDTTSDPTQLVTC